MDWGEVQCFLLEGVHGLKQSVNLLLQSGDIVSHFPELVRVLEVVGAAVRRILAGEVEVAAALTRRLAIALDLAPLALVAEVREDNVSLLWSSVSHPTRRSTSRGCWSSRLSPAGSSPCSSGGLDGRDLRISRLGCGLLGPGRVTTYQAMEMYCKRSQKQRSARQIPSRCLQMLLTLFLLLLCCLCEESSLALSLSFRFAPAVAATPPFAPPPPPPPPFA